MQQCPVCNIEGAEVKDLSGQQLGNRVTCPRCGEFSYTIKAEDFHIKHLNDNRSRNVLSYAIRQAQQEMNPPLFDHERVKKILDDNYLPGPFEQSENLILWIGENQPTTGSKTAINFTKQLSVIGAQSNDDIDYLIKQLEKEDIIESQGITRGTGYLRLTFEGWHRYREILAGKTDSRRAFMAMKYGDDTLDNLFKQNWRPAVEKTGFSLFRLDEKPKTGSIINRMRNEIRKSKFLLADLTHDNLGAYWEAGYAEGLGKPVVYLCEKKQFEETKTHFDVNQQQTVVWDLEDLSAAEKALKLVIRNTLYTEAKLED